MITEFWWGNILEDSHLGDQEGDGRNTLRWIVWEVYGTESGLYPMAGFGINDAEPLGSAVTVLVQKFLV
jgi:hypothetical protein